MDSVVACTSGGLVVLSPTDGSVRWSDSTVDSALTPAVTNDIVVSDGLGFTAVAPDGGYRFLGHRFDYQHWHTDIRAYPQSPATVTKNYLIAGIGIQGRSEGGGRVVAVNRTDGSVAWSTQVDSSVWGAPAVVDGTVYAAQRSASSPEASAVVYAMDGDTGSVEWKTTFSSHPKYDPIDAVVATTDLVYVSMVIGPLIALDATSGDVVWKLDPPTGVRGSPALADGTLYVGDLDGTFHALDATTGQTRWTASVGRWLGGPTVGKRGVYAASLDGTLVSWQPDGTERWRIQIDVPVETTPTIANNDLYIGTGDGLLYCLG